VALPSELVRGVVGSRGAESFTNPRRYPTRSVAATT
jgi:hypothetical protein